MKKWVLGLGLASLVWLCGCVERALVITSEPSGADVTVNQQWKGKTPYVVPFKHYGVYDIWIEHPGYEEEDRLVKFYPLHVGEPIKAPGYQYAGMDFITEVLLPKTLRDQHNLHYVLELVDAADDVGDVLSRAQQLRDASKMRTRMRYEKDVERGRIPAGSAVVEEAAEYAPGDSGAFDENYYDGTIDPTPPMPSEMPVYER